MSNKNGSRLGSIVTYSITYEKALNLAQLASYAEQALSMDVKIPQKASYAITRNSIFLSGARKEYNEAKEAIIEKYAEKGKDGKMATEDKVINQDQIDAAKKAGVEENRIPAPQMVKYPIFKSKEVENKVEEEIKMLTEELVNVRLHRFPDLENWEGGDDIEHGKVTLLWRIADEVNEIAEPDHGEQLKDALYDLISKHPSLSEIKFGLGKELSECDDMSIAKEVRKFVDQIKDKKT
jgi:hypothetical protein